MNYVSGSQPGPSISHGVEDEKWEEIINPFFWNPLEFLKVESGVPHNYAYFPSDLPTGNIWNH